MLRFNSYDTRVSKKKKPIRYANAYRIACKRLSTKLAYTILDSYTFWKTCVLRCATKIVRKLTTTGITTRRNTFYFYRDDVCN